MPLPLPSSPTLYDFEKLRYSYQDFDLYLAWIPIDRNLFFLRSTRASGWSEQLDFPISHYPQNPGSPPGPIAQAWTAPRLPHCRIGPHRIAFQGEPVTFSARNSLALGPAPGLAYSTGLYNVLWFRDGAGPNSGLWDYDWTPPGPGLHTVSCRLHRSSGGFTYEHTAFRKVYVAQNRDELARKFPLIGVGNLSGGMDSGGTRVTLKLGWTDEISPTFAIVVLLAECRYDDTSGPVHAIPGYSIDRSHPARYASSILFSGYADEQSYQFDARRREITLTARTGDLILERLQSEFTPFTSTTGYGHRDPNLTIPSAVWHMLQSHSNFLDWHDFDLYYDLPSHQIPSWAFEKGSAWDAIRAGAENEFLRVYCTPQGALRMHPDLQLLSPTDLGAFFGHISSQTGQPSADVFMLNDPNDMQQMSTVGGVPAVIRTSPSSHELVPLDLTLQKRSVPASDWVQVIATPGTTGGALFVTSYPPSSTPATAAAVVDQIFLHRPTIYDELVAMNYDDTGWRRVPRRAAFLQWLAYSTAAQGRNPLEIGHPTWEWKNTYPNTWDLPTSELQYAIAGFATNYSYSSDLWRVYPGGPYRSLYMVIDDGTPINGRTASAQNDSNIYAYARSVGWIESEPPTTSRRPWKVVQGRFVGGLSSVYGRLRTIAQRLWETDQDQTPAASFRLPMCPGLSLGYLFSRSAWNGMYRTADYWFVAGLAHDFDFESRTWLTSFEVAHYAPTVTPDPVLFTAPRPLAAAPVTGNEDGPPDRTNPLAELSAPAWWPLSHWPPSPSSPFPGANPTGQRPGPELTGLPSGLGWMPPDPDALPSERPDWWPASWIWPGRLGPVPDPLPDWWPATLPHPGLYGSAPVIPPGYPEPVRADGTIGWEDVLPEARPDWWCYHWEWPPAATPWNHASRGTPEELDPADADWTTETSPVPPRQQTSGGLTVNPEPPCRLAGRAGFTPQSYLDDGMRSRLQLVLKGMAGSGAWPQIQVKARGIVGTVLETVDDWVSVPISYEYDLTTDWDDIWTIDLVWTNPTAGPSLFLHAVGWASLPATGIDAWREATPALTGYYASGGGEVEFTNDEYTTLLSTGQLPAKDGLKVSLDVYDLRMGNCGLTMPRTTTGTRLATANTAAQSGTMSVQGTVDEDQTFVFQCDGGSDDGYDAQGYLPTPSGVRPGQPWSLEWHGLYSVTAAGQYEFEVISNGAQTTIEIDGQSVISLEDEQDAVGKAARSGYVEDGVLHGAPWYLTPGWHDFRIQFSANGQTSNQQILRIQWKAPGGDWADLSTADFEVPAWQ